MRLGWRSSPERSRPSDALNRKAPNTRSSINAPHLRMRVTSERREGGSRYSEGKAKGRTIRLKVAMESLRRCEA